MILKGRQRGHAADLAVHLMNAVDNERIELAEIYGTVAMDLDGALHEIEAVSTGTKATQPFYTLIINPSEKLTRAQYFEAIAAIEQRLGLESQPRAVLFHIKHGREHCHVVWSRIDADEMKAIHMAHDRRRLMDMACELCHRFGLDMPDGLKKWEAKEKYEKEKLDLSLAEKAQEEQTGISPEDRRAEITVCYEQSDTAEAFRAALEHKGYVLPRGDQRNFVVVDRFGNPHSLTRYIKGHKRKDIRAKLASLSVEDLPGVDQAKEYQRKRQRAREEKQKEGEGERSQRLEQQRKTEREALDARHAAQRAEISGKEQELLTRQQQETLSLHAAQLSESKGLIFRVRSTVAALIAKAPGLRSVLGPIQNLTHLDPKERHALQREALASRHRREREEIARLKRAQARIETRERAALERKLRKATRLARELEQTVRQDFYEAALDPVVRKQTGIREGELRVEFNDAGEFVEGPFDDGGGDDDGRKPSWKQRAEEKRRGLKPLRGKGYGRRRGDQ